MNFTSYGATDKGNKRSRNVNAYLLHKGSRLAVVIDGRCGQGGGELKAAIALKAIGEVLEEANAERPAREIHAR